MFCGSIWVPSSMVKFSFLLEHVDIKDGTKMLSQTISDEPTCAVGGSLQSHILSHKLTLKI